MTITSQTKGVDEPAGKLAELGARFASTSYARRGAPASADPIEVVLADDHEMIREGLRALLRPASDIVVVGEAGDGDEAFGLAERLKPDMIILDLDMPGSGGLATLLRLRARVPEVKALVLTMYSEHDKLLPVLEAGARGYLSKQAASLDLLEAIRVVASGDIYVRPIAARLLAAAVIPRRAARTAADLFSELSHREQMIVTMVAEGYSGAEIARRLHLSTKTVAAYKERVKDKLGLGHRTEYVRFAFEAGILGVRLLAAARG